MAIAAETKAIQGSKPAVATGTAKRGARGKRVAIVGAGPGGLAAAVLLAASGLEVTVFEAGSEVGGRTARVRAGQAGEFAFDKGPTFFMMPYVLEEVFAAAGKRLRDCVDMTRLDPMYRLLLGRAGQGHLTLDATQDVAEMSRRIGTINARDGANFARFLNDNRYKLHHSEPILRNPMRSPLDLFRKNTWLDTLKVGPVLAPHLSVHQLLGKYFDDPYVKLAVSFQSKYLGMSPFECPSLFTILPFIEYEYGIWHPRGGCHALMIAMAKLAGELGAKIVTDCPVARVEVRGGVASGVSFDRGPHAGEALGFDHVVLNADAAWAMQNLLPASERARAGGQYGDEHLQSRRYSCSTFMLYIGVRGSVDLPHHTIYVSETYKENLDDIVVRGCLSEDPSVYLCNPSRIDPTLAPAGDSSLYMLMPTPNCNTSVEWEREYPVLRERMLDQVEKRMGLSDLRSRIVAEVQVGPTQWRDSNIQYGATFNLAHNLGQMLHKRPHNKLKGFDNLYLVGGGTHPGSGLPTIFLSAQISARMLCEQAGVTFAGDGPAPRAIAAARG